MSQQAIGMIETRGLVALIEATDAMLKSANVELVGPMIQVGNAMVTVCVTGDVAAVKAATEAGKTAAQSLGEIVSVSVIAKTCAEADAWATALNVLGVENGLPLAEREHIGAQFVTEDAGQLTIRASPAWPNSDPLAAQR